MRDILILQTARLGDLAQTAPMLRSLRRNHPGARLTLVAQAGPAGLLADSGLCDRLVCVPYDELGSLADPAVENAFPGIGSFAAEPAFSAEYDLLVNLSNDLGTAVLCRRIAARRKLGRIHSFEGELRLLGPWSKYLYAMVTHRRENLFNLVDIQTGIAGLAPHPETVSLPVSEGRRIEALALLAGFGIRPGRLLVSGKPLLPGQPLAAGQTLVPGQTLVALQAGASSLHRAWSLENFAALGAGLRLDPGVQLVLLGDAREKDRCAELAQRIGGEGVANLAGATSLAQMHAVLAVCDLLISNDTGSVHVAAAAGTATLGLYFSTAYYAETAPYGAGHTVMQTEIACAPCDASNVCAVQKCREFLPAGAVLETARWLLSGAPTDAAPAAAPNLSLYRSRFLKDGSLAYLPVRTEAASAHFQEALLGRLLWQDAMGLGGDPALDELRLRLSREEPFRRLRETLTKALADLEIPVRRGLELAVALRAEFSAGMPAHERILSLHGELADLAVVLASASKSAGLCGSFLHFEMMDMDYVAYPSLAGILEEKYRMLADWLARFRATLGGMG
ncbi:MAG: glycosyltransferase family 9 protein [Fibrobacteres bacterium]|nr:glycosyltransferase family 9 protein [Fibrobacterota bacterium]